MKHLYWVAGFLEGEGCFRAKTFGIIAAQVQREPLDRLQALFGGSIILRIKTYQPNAQPIFIWTICGHRAAEVMMTLFSLMSPQRKERIRTALTLWLKVRAGPRYRTHCVHGHRYDEENTRRENGKTSASGIQLARRRCKACVRSYSERYRANRRESRRLVQQRRRAKDKSEVSIFLRRFKARRRYAEPRRGKFILASSDA